MARIARVVAPGVPHLITQRGNRRQDTFFEEEDYRSYTGLMGEWCARYGVAVWAYCLMPNHVHMIAVPAAEDSLRRAIGEAHRRYTRKVNARQQWKGHLWQGRFASYPMEDNYILTAARYIELNPVRAGLLERSEDYPWSSAKAHLTGQNDELVRVEPLLERVLNWQSLLSEQLFEDQLEEIRKHERTGRPLGSESFVISLEEIVGRILRRQKPGPSPGRKRRKK